MSQGKAVAFARGKLNPTAFYIRLKGGAVYRWPQSVGTMFQVELTQAIRVNHGGVSLKHWIKVR